VEVRIRTTQLNMEKIAQQALYWEVQGFKRQAKDSLERRDQKVSTKNGTHLGRGGSSSPQQTRMASMCGPVRPHKRGLNQDKDASLTVMLYVRFFI